MDEKGSGNGSGAGHGKRYHLRGDRGGNRPAGGRGRARGVFIRPGPCRARPEQDHPAGYKILGLQTYFTVGPKETRAWTIPVGARAPEAAGVIHSDFQKGFIRAETIAYDDFVALNGEQGAKDAGKMRQEGKDYIVKDGDIILFRFNV